MKFLIVGPGAMGCLFAARLKKAGHDVTLFDHIIKRADLIDSQGVKVEGILGEYTVQVPTVAGKILDILDDEFHPLLRRHRLQIARLPIASQDVRRPPRTVTKLNSGDYVIFRGRRVCTPSWYTIR